MKIAYVVNTRIPTEKAHGWQIMRVCSELASQGHEVTLYVPKRHNPIVEDAFTFYALPETFSITKVRCFDALRFVKFLGPLAFKLTSVSFLHALQIPRDCVIYTRDADAVEYLSQKGYTVFYNAHNWEDSRGARVKYAKGIVCNSRGTEKAVLVLGLPTIVAPNATDPNPYIDQPKNVLRFHLGISEGPVALYAGHLHGWKGSDILTQAAKLLPDMTFAILGECGETQGNLKFLGHKPHAEVAKYLAAADVLLLPNIPEGESEFTSPLKMFEYMASGTPIVASDLPAIREVLSEKTSVLVEPGSAQALVEGIRAVTPAHAAAALEESKKYSWGSHAQKVADFISSVCKPTT